MGVGGDREKESSEKNGSSTTENEMEMPALLVLCFSLLEHYGQIFFSSSPSKKKKKKKMGVRIRFYCYVYEKLKEK